MKICSLLAVFMLLAAGQGRSAPPASIPGPSGETQRYSINWPSGLSLGEAEIVGSRSNSNSPSEHLNFQLKVDASIPGFQVSDNFRSEASPAFCSDEFEKKILHGRRQADEKTKFSSDGTAKRETKGGGHTDLSTPSCAKDALTYLFFVRRELSEGRLPQEETVYFGAPYKVRLEFSGTQQIQVGDKNVPADKLVATARGESANIQFEVYFLKDAARTLAMVKVPFAMGTFAMTLEK